MKIAAAADASVVLQNWASFFLFGEMMVGRGKFIMQAARYLVGFILTCSLSFSSIPYPLIILVVRVMTLVTLEKYYIVGFFLLTCIGTYLLEIRVNLVVYRESLQ